MERREQRARSGGFQAHPGLLLFRQGCRQLVSFQPDEGLCSIGQREELEQQLFVAQFRFV